MAFASGLFLALAVPENGMERLDQVLLMTDMLLGEVLPEDEAREPYVESEVLALLSAEREKTNS